MLKTVSPARQDWHALEQACPSRHTTALLASTAAWVHVLQHHWKMYTVPIKLSARVLHVPWVTSVLLAHLHLASVCLAFTAMTQASVLSVDLVKLVTIAWPVLRVQHQLIMSPGLYVLEGTIACLASPVPFLVPGVGTQALLAISMQAVVCHVLVGLAAHPWVLLWSRFNVRLGISVLKVSPLTLHLSLCVLLGTTVPVVALSQCHVKWVRTRISLASQCALIARLAPIVI